jgi:hypothetical protein
VAGNLDRIHLLYPDNSFDANIIGFYEKKRQNYWNLSFLCDTVRDRKASRTRSAATSQGHAAIVFSAFEDNGIKVSAG